MNNKERNEKILRLTCEMLEKMNFEIDKAFVEDMEGEENQVLIGLTVSNPAGLIGFRGRNLAAIQLILSLAVKNKLGEWVRILLDVNNYRQEQKERLVAMVQGLAQKVLATGNPAVMTNMSSYERRVCHMAASNMEGISTESEGEGEERHIVIKLKQ
jgi:spoIIIJ-associated protein